MARFTRRDFFKITGAATAGIASGGLIAANTAAAASKAPMMAAVNRVASLPKAKGPRVIVVGGGWSGLTMAKYLKRDHPKFDVVLIEKRAMFMSCPISNLWLADVVNLEFLHRSFLDAARYGKYTFFNAHSQVT